VSWANEVRASEGAMKGDRCERGERVKRRGQYEANG